MVVVAGVARAPCNSFRSMIGAVVVVDGEAAVGDGAAVSASIASGEWAHSFGFCAGTDEFARSN